VVVRGHEAGAGALVGDRLVDRVEGVQRVARKVNLRDHPLGELGAEQREVDVRRPPGIVMVVPRVRTGLDGREGVPARVVGQAAAGAREVRVERRGVLVTLVHVPAGRVGLPDLHQLAPDRPAVTVQHAAAYHDARPDRLTGAADRQIRLQRIDIGPPEDRRDQLGPLRVRRPQVPGRMAQDRAAVRREVQPRLRLAGRRVGLDLLDLLADDPLAHQAGLEDGNAHASHATRRHPGKSTLDFR
jgi:hypothetical protein